RISLVTSGVSRSNKRYSWFEYDSEGRGISSYHPSNIYSSGRSGFSDKFTFNYHLKSTTVTNPLGHKSVYKYYTERKNNLYEVSYEGTPYCAASVMTESRIYPNPRRDGDYDLKKTDRNGNVTKDVLRNDVLMSRTFAEGTDNEQTISMTWHANYNLITELKRGNVTEKYDYDEQLNNKLREVNFDNKSYKTTNEYLYHPNNLVKKVTTTHPTGAVTINEYNSQGLLVKTLNANGNITSYGDYNNLGLAHTITLPDLTKAKYTYDSRGKIKTKKNISITGKSLTTTYSYNAFDKIKTAIRSDGIALTYEYDNRGLLTSEKSQRLIGPADDIAFLEKRHSYDLMGNLTSTSYGEPQWMLIHYPCQAEPSSTKSFSTLAIFPIPTDPRPRPICEYGYKYIAKYEINYKYDSMGNLVKVIDNNYNVLAYMTYDGNGNRLTEIDAKGARNKFQYDAFDRVIKHTNPYNKVTEYEYDISKVSKIIDARRNTTKYENNPIMGTEDLNSPDTKLTSFTYDELGNKLTKNDARGIITSYSYNRLGQMVSQVNSVNLTWDYGL
ncbi:MAG: RHS repeat protein, partial [Gammaproteobacteria bacterium]|nr:RHS repeat protein [Gammaproteobacteria bacterium]